MSSVNIFEITEEGIIIEIKRNELFNIVFYVYDIDGDPADLTDFKVWFYLFNEHGQDESEAVIVKRNTEAGGNPLQISMTDLEGKCSVIIAPSDTINLDGNQFYYTLKIQGASTPELEILYPYKFELLIVKDDSIYEFNGWNIDKKQIAYFALGSESRFAEVPDFICETAVNNMCLELNTYQSNWCSSVDKTDKTLNDAIVYYAVCEMKNSGNSSESAGDIISESIGDKRITYSNEQRSNVSKISMPHNSCDRAAWLVKQFAISKKKASGKIQMSIKNYRSKTFGGIYNKYTEDYNYGEP